MFKQINKNKKIKSIVVTLFLALVLSTGIFVAQAQPAKADSLDVAATCAADLLGIDTAIDNAIHTVLGWLGLGGLLSAQVPVDDKTNNAQTKLKRCLSSALIEANRKYVGTYINRLLAKYTIVDYLRYGVTLTNQIYVANQLKGMSEADKMVIQANVNNILKIVVKNSIDLSGIYKKRSLAALSLSKLGQGEVWANASMQVVGNPLAATPQGQQFMAELAAQDIASRAQNAASQAVNNSNGKKDAFNCNRSNSALSALCNVVYPAQYVTSQIDAKIQQLFGQQLTPQDNATAIALFYAKVAAGQAPAQVLGAPLTADQQASLSEDAYPDSGFCVDGYDGDGNPC